MTGGGHTGPGMRVSDAERAAVAERLARHYSDGRLDKAEFDQRVDQAMRAKAQADLDALLADLPDADTPAAPGSPEAPAPNARRRPRRVLLLALVIVLAVTVGPPLAWSFLHLAWIALAVGAIVVLVTRARRRHS